MGFIFAYYRASDTYVTDNQEFPSDIHNMVMLGDVLTVQSVITKMTKKQDGPDKIIP